MLPAFFILLVIVMLHIKYDYIRSLWETTLGLKMCAAAVVLLALSMFVISTLSFLKNRLEREARGRRFLLACAFGFTYLVLITPVCFVVLLGPAAIQIVEGFR